MSEVGALIIRLQAETAQFRSDMGKVKGDLDELKGKTGEFGESTDYSMHEAKGSLMLVEESLGVHIPRHLNALIAEIPGVGAAFAAMLPLVGVFAAITIIGELIQKHRELKEEAAKVEQGHNALGATIASVYSSLNDKFLQAGIKADELRGDHLAALQKQLELIDHQSMEELAHQFDVLAKAADTAFSTLKAHWYQLGSGSERAKHNLEEFQSQYELLLKTGKTDEANKLLQDRLAYEERILSLQKEMRSSYSPDAFALGDYLTKDTEKVNTLKAAHVGLTEKEIESQQDLVDILHAQVDAHSQIAKTTAVEKGVSTTKDVLKGLSDEASLQKIVAAGTDAHAAALRKLAQTQAETALAADKGNQEESPEEKLDKTMSAIEQGHEAAIQAAEQILQSKKSVYDAELKAAGQNAAKKKELDAQYANEVQAHDDAIVQADEEAHKKSVAATTTAAVEKRNADIAEAQAQADGVLNAVIKGAQSQEKAAIQKAKVEEALRKATAEQTIAAEVAAGKAEVAAEVQGYNDRIKALDKYAKDYEKKVQELQSKIKEITQKGEADQLRITTDAEQKKALAIQQAESRMYQSIADNIAKSIVMNQSLVQSFRQTGEQLLEGMIRNLIMMELTHDREKLINAKGAFDKSYNWASAWGGPVAGAIAGATSFAAVMAFEQGGKIPGQGAVPIIGHGGETVVTKALTDRVESAEGKNGNKSGDIHMHNTFAPNVHALDSEGVDRVLAKHSTTFQRHITSAIRRMNK